MEAILSNRKLGAADCAWITLPLALFLLFYLLADFEIVGRVSAPDACRLNAHFEYPVPRG